MVVTVSAQFRENAGSADSHGGSRQRNISMPAACCVNLLVREGCSRNPHVAITPHMIQQRVQSEHAALQIRSCLLAERVKGFPCKAQQMCTIPWFSPPPVITQPANSLSRRQRNRYQHCGCDRRGEPAVVFRKESNPLLGARTEVLELHTSQYCMRCVHCNIHARMHGMRQMLQLCYNIAGTWPQTCIEVCSPTNRDERVAQPPRPASASYLWLPIYSPSLVRLR